MNLKKQKIFKINRIYIISLKNLIIPIIILFFITFLLIFSKNNIYAAKQGLNLFLNNIIPSMLPFFIAVELLSYTDIIYKISNFLNPIIKPIFNVPGIGAYIFIMGIISGYPTGAKLISNYKKEKILTTIEAERLISYTNNSGPLFILGTIGLNMFNSNKIGFLLLSIHILSALSVGFLFRFWKSNNKYKNNIINNKTIINNTKNINISNFGECLSKSIISSINTILLIGGFIILFSVIISILENSKLLNYLSQMLSPFFNILCINNIGLIKSILSGLIEITNGINNLTNTSSILLLKICFTSFLLGFGGISIFFQVLSITYKENINIKPYIIGKVLQAIFSIFYTLLFTKLFPIFYL